MFVFGRSSSSSSSGFYFSVGDDTILFMFDIYNVFILILYKCFFFFLFFFIFFSIYLLFGCSLFWFLPTSERGQETPTSWPLLPCPVQFEEVVEEWIVGKNSWKNRRKGGRRKEGERKEKRRRKEGGRMGSSPWYCLDFSPLDTSDSFY